MEQDANGRWGYSATRVVEYLVGELTLPQCAEDEELGCVVDLDEEALAADFVDAT